MYEATNLFRDDCVRQLPASRSPCRSRDRRPGSADLFAARACPTDARIFRAPTIWPHSRRSNGRSGMKAVLTRRGGRQTRTRRGCANRAGRAGRAAATARLRRKAATGRAARRATSAATTRSGSIRDRRYTIVNGEARTSLVVDPPDGRLPALTPAARQRLGALLARPSAENDPGLDPTPGAYDDPERRPLGERCLLGFGSAAGPPALPNYFYNNLRKIVQTPDRVADPQRDGARRARGPNERPAPAVAHPQVGG